MLMKPEEIYSERLAEKTSRANCCDSAVVALKESLSKELGDELMASQKYEEAGFKMQENTDFPEFAKVLHKMALQEYEHWIRLVATINILNEVCECKTSSEV